MKFQHAQICPVLLVVMLPFDGSDSMMGPPGGPDGPFPGPDSIMPCSASSGGMQGPAAATAASAVPDLPGVNRPAKKQERGNDYCQHFVDTGVRPQNFLRGTQQQQ
jgi:hypothetical protein